MVVIPKMFSLPFTAFACVFFFFLFYLFPAQVLTAQVRGGRLILTLLALCGFYCLAFYLKPKGIPLGVFPWGVVVVSLVLAWKKRPSLSQFVPDFPLLVICLLFFPILLSRWEPPSYDDPVKWGTLARLLIEYQVVPGDTRPLTQVTELSAATLGVPIQIAVVSLGGNIPLERVVFFWSCLALVLFYGVFALALEHWFARRHAQWVACTAMAVFSNPQLYLSWGGTPTLLGMTGGLAVLAIKKILFDQEVKTSPSFLLLSILSICFSAYAHPIGVYVSVWVVLPLLLLEKNLYSKKIFLSLLAIGAGAIVCTIPFLLTNTGQIDPADLERTREWHRLMAPFLFREAAPLYNLYSQMMSYLWSTSAVAALLLCFLMLQTPRGRRLFPAFAVGTVVIGYLIYNTKWWALPLSPLLYPERIGTLWILPLSLGIGWIMERAEKNKITGGICLLFFGFFAVHQFLHRNYPYWGGSHGMTEKDRRAMESLAHLVPREECIRIDRQWPSAWIPVIGFRCTIPSHPLSGNTIFEEVKSQPKEVRYLFLSEKERLSKKEEALPGVILLDDGALLLKLSDYSSSVN